MKLILTLNNQPFIYDKLGKLKIFLNILLIPS